MKCGETRVWFDPARSGDINDAITAEDMRRLIKDGIVRKLPKHGVSNYRKNIIARQKKKGRRSGRGSRKGALGTRMPKKKQWMSRIRAIRKLLRELRDAGRIDNAAYRATYRKARSGFFRSRSHVMIHLERNNMLKEAAAGGEGKEKK